MTSGGRETHIRLCPHCGIDLLKAVGVRKGEWTIQPNGIASYGDKPVAMAPQQVQILYTLAAANGRVISLDALLNRMSDSDDITLVRSLVSRIRTSLRQQNIPCPVENVWGRGMRWAV